MPRKQLTMKGESLMYFYGKGETTKIVTEKLSGYSAGHVPIQIDETVAAVFGCQCGSLQSVRSGPASGYNRETPKFSSW